MNKEIYENICILIPESKQVDTTNAGAFGAELKEMLKGYDKYLIDLQNLVYLDSSGLGVLVSALRQVNEVGGQMVFCSPSSAVDVLFRMVRLSQIATVCKDRQEAFKTLFDQE